MAGIYIHIPFCKVKCHYCDFHFSVQLKNRTSLVNAICQELVLRKKFFQKEEINTIYFGGGTPSVIEVNLLDKILNTIHANYTVSSKYELTVECNPDDLNPEKLKDFSQIGVNRLSIGIQSFDDKVLTFMNRAHSSKQAINSVNLARKFGFENLTIDLIYGVPDTTLKTWEKELEHLKNLAIPHLSAYCLTIEEKTVFGNWQKKGIIQPFSDEISLNQFEYLIDFSEKNGYEQYEISNFSKKGFISKHNSSYWLGEKYLGVGPSAHSYNGKNRSWNISNNPNYIKRIENNTPYFEEEILTSTDQFNEYILTRLRTKWGIDLNDLNTISESRTQTIVSVLEKQMELEHINKVGNIYTLTKKGKFLADAISADLFH